MQHTPIFNDQPIPEWVHVFYNQIESSMQAFALHGLVFEHAHHEELSVTLSYKEFTVLYDFAKANNRFEQIEVFRGSDRVDVPERIKPTLSRTRAEKNIAALAEWLDG